jgi:hypothetical protein
MTMMQLFPLKQALYMLKQKSFWIRSNNKISELRTILQRESQNS